MRSRLKDRQRVWICRAEERLDGIDTIQGLTKPVEIWATVSHTIDYPDRTQAGIILDYDRYVVLYDMRIEVKEGYLLFVDREPEFDELGELLNEPDYKVRRVIATQKGIVKRLGIRHVEGLDE